MTDYFEWTGAGQDADWGDIYNWLMEPNYPYNPTIWENASPGDLPPPPNPATGNDVAAVSGATITGSGAADAIYATNVVFAGSFTFGWANYNVCGIYLTGSVEVTGSVTQDTDDSLASGATLTIEKGGVYTLGWGNTTGGSFVNDGTVICADSYSQYINSSGDVVPQNLQSTPFTNNGTLTVDAGDEFFLVSANGSSPAGSTLDGTIDGAGTLDIGTSVTLAPTSLTVGTLSLDVGDGDGLGNGVVTLGANITYGGQLLMVGGGGDTLDLDDHTFTLTGSSNTLGGTIYGGGTIQVTGAAEVNGLTVGSSSDANATVLEDSGTLTGEGGWGFGNASEFLIDANASYILAAALSAGGGGGSIVNNGQLTDADPTDGTSTIVGSFTNNGTLTVDAGDTLMLSNGAAGQTLDGTVAGAGVIVLNNMNTYLAATSLSVGALTVEGGSVFLEGNVSYAGVLSLQQSHGGAGNIDLGGHTLTLSGSGNVLGSDGAVSGPGTLLVTGSAALTVSGGQFTLNSGTLEDAGQLTVANSWTCDGELLIDSSGAITIDGGVSLSGGGSIVNNGSMVFMASAGTASISPVLNNSGTLTIDGGSTADTIDVDASTLGGVITGSGTLGLVGDDTLSATSVSVGLITLLSGTTTLGADVDVTGSFYFDSHQNGAASLNLAGYTLTLAQVSDFWGGGNWGGGEVLVTGNTTFNSSADSILGLGSSTGSLVIDGQVTLNGTGDLDGSVTLDAGGGLTLDGQISSAKAGAAIVFNGANASLTMEQLSAGYVSAFPISGLGIGDIIDLSGVTATGASINASNQIVVTDNGSTFATLQLSGSNSGLALATIANASGFEIIALPAPATVADYLVYTTDYDKISGGFGISDSASVIIPELSTLAKDADIVALSFTSGKGSLKAGAQLVAPAVSETGAGTSLTIAENLSYSGALTQGAGAKLTVSSGDALTLSGANSLSGSIAGAGALALTGGDATFQAGAALTASTWSLSGAAAATLAENLTYAGAFSAGAGTSVALGGTLTLKGATTLTGVTVSSASALKLLLEDASSVSGLTLAGQAVVDVATFATQSGGSITVGDQVATDKAELLNSATGTWDIGDGSGIARGAGASSFIDNLGLFEKTGAGTSTIATVMTNASHVLVAAGKLDFQAAVTGIGADTISGAATLEFDSSVASGQSIGFTGADGTLYLGTSAGFGATISGFDISGGGTGDAVELLGDWTKKNFSENTTDTLATLTLANGATHLRLKFSGGYSATSFHVSQSGGVTTID